MEKEKTYILIYKVIYPSGNKTEHEERGITGFSYRNGEMAVWYPGDQSMAGMTWNVYGTLTSVLLVEQVV